MENTHRSSNQRTKRIEKREIVKGIGTRTGIDETAKTGTMSETGTGGTTSGIGTGTEIAGTEIGTGSEKGGEKGKWTGNVIVRDKGSPTLRNPWKR